MTDGRTVYVVICCKPGEDQVRHIFSTVEHATAFCQRDTGRAHVMFDYLLDCPERHELTMQ